MQLVFTQVLALFSVQSGMLEYNTSPATSDQALVFAQVFFFSLYSLECGSRIHSPATSKQALVFAQVIVLFSV